MNKEILAETGDEKSTKDDSQQVSQACINANVGGMYGQEKKLKPKK